MCWGRKYGKVETLAESEGAREDRLWEVTGYRLSSSSSSGVDGVVRDGVVELVSCRVSSYDRAAPRDTVPDTVPEGSPLLTDLNDVPAAHRCILNKWTVNSSTQIPFSAVASQDQSIGNISTLFDEFFWHQQKKGSRDPRMHKWNVPAQVD